MMNKLPVPDMTFIDHLAELRGRLMVCLIGLTLAAVFCYGQAPQWAAAFTGIGGKALKLAYFSVAEGFSVRVKIAVLVGAILISPLLFWQAAAFINPGLTGRERRMIQYSALLLSLFFLGGTAFGYWILLPRLLAFLFALGLAYLKPALSGDAYFSFILEVLCLSGIIFAFFPVLLVMGRFGLVDAALLRKGRKYFWLALISFGGIIAPIADLWGFLLMVLPLGIFYEIAILCFRQTTQRGNAEEAAK
jgi:sec-independent protein translocase protein TatC